MNEQIALLTSLVQWLKTNTIGTQKDKNDSDDDDDDDNMSMKIFFSLLVEPF